MKQLILSLGVIVCCLSVEAQSFEFMPGSKRIFIDAQYLKFFDNNQKVSLFSRSRATSEYDESNTDLFSGAYLNYTSSLGLGGTVLARISSNSSGLDMGIHYFKAYQSMMLYALLSVNLNDELLYSWFSIFRYTPLISDGLELYFSLELFSAFDDLGHLSSVQRVRLGLDKHSYQFGIAINLNDSRFTEWDLNPGLFLRKQF